MTYGWGTRELPLPAVHGKRRKKELYGMSDTRHARKKKLKSEKQFNVSFEVRPKGSDPDEPWQKRTLTRISAPNMSSAAKRVRDLMAQAWPPMEVQKIVLVERKAKA